MKNIHDQMKPIGELRNSINRGTPFFYYYHFIPCDEFDPKFNAVILRGWSALQVFISDTKWSAYIQLFDEINAERQP